MKIAVLVKECQVLEEGFELDGTDIDAKYFDFTINETDEFTVEEAVQIKESGSFGDVEIVVVTIGPARSVQTLRKVLAMGADRAIRVWDDELDSQALRDRHLKARILSAIIEEEAPDLVFAGVQSDDDSFGGTGVMVANEIGYEWAAAVVDIEIVDAEDCIRVERELEGGAVETVELEPPAVLTVQAGINEPRYISMRNIYSVGSQKEVAEMDLATIGIDSTTATELPITGIRRPEKSTSYIDGDTDDVASQLHDLLEDEAVTR